MKRISLSLLSLVFFFWVANLALASMHQEIEVVAFRYFEEEDQLRILGIEGNLDTTLLRIRELLETGRDEKEQGALRELENVVEDDLVFIRESIAIFESELGELERHNKVINLILDKIE